MRRAFPWLAVFVTGLLPSLAWPDWRAASLGLASGAAVALATARLLGRFDSLPLTGFAGRFGAALFIHGIVFAALVALSVIRGLPLIAVTAPYAILASGGLLITALSFSPASSPAHVR